MPRQTVANKTPIEYLLLTDDEKRKKLKEKLKKRILLLMKKHIGKDNAVSGEDFFTKILEVSPYDLNVFEVSYLWNELRGLIREMRREGSVFIVNGVRKMYVLQSQYELNSFHNRVDTTIRNLERLKDRASDWVKNQGYRRL